MKIRRANNNGSLCVGINKNMEFKEGDDVIWIPNPNGHWEIRKLELVE